MMKRKYMIIVAALILAIGIGTGFYVSDKGLSDVSLVSTAEAAGGKAEYSSNTRVPQEHRSPAICLLPWNRRN